MRTKCSIKDGMGGPIGSRNHAVQQHKKSGNKWSEDLKSLKNQNKMIYSIANKSVSRREIKNIKKIRAEASKKTSVSSSEDWHSGSSLAMDSSLDKHRQPDIPKEINKLYHLVTYNLNNYNDQSNEAIDNEPTFGNSSFNLSSGASDPLPVVTVSLRGGKKHGATVVSGLTCLWYSEATDSMIKYDILSIINSRCGQI